MNDLIQSVFGAEPRRVPVGESGARLVARLEAATLGSRELDCLVIAAVVGCEAAISERDGRWHLYDGKDRRGEPRLWESRDEFGVYLRRALVDERGPTRSVDAALTLVPKGHRTSLADWSTSDSSCRARVFRGHDFTNWHKAKTLPLALCIAALHARASAPLSPTG